MSPSRRSQIACSSASSARPVSNDVEARHPTMRRENTSVTNATYTNPTRVGTYVISAIHNRFGAAAVKSRSTRSPGRANASSGIVVTVKALPRVAPRSPI